MVGAFHDHDLVSILVIGRWIFFTLLGSWVVKWLSHLPAALEAQVHNKIVIGHKFDKDWINIANF